MSDCCRPTGIALPCRRVDIGVCDTVDAIESEIEIILNDFVGSDEGCIERCLPVLIVWAWPAIEIELQIGAAPNSLREAFEIKCAAGLIGRAEGVAEFLKTAVDRDGGAWPNFELRIAHVKAQIAGVVGNVPAIGENGGGVAGLSQTEREKRYKEEVAVHSNN